MREHGACRSSGASARGTASSTIALFGRASLSCTREQGNYRLGHDQQGDQNTAMAICYGHIPELQPARSEDVRMP